MRGNGTQRRFKKINKGKFQDCAQRILYEQRNNNNGTKLSSKIQENGATFHTVFIATHVMTSKSIPRVQSHVFFLFSPRYGRFFLILRGGVSPPEVVSHFVPSDPHTCCSAVFSTHVCTYLYTTSRRVLSTVRNSPSTQEGAV